MDVSTDMVFKFEFLICCDCISRTVFPVPSARASAVLISMGGWTPERSRCKNNVWDPSSSGSDFLAFGRAGINISSSCMKPRFSSICFFSLTLSFGSTAVAAAVPNMS